MKKKIIAVSIIAVLAAVCLIPVTREQSIPIKASFFDTYRQLDKAENWKKWRSDLREASRADSSRVTDTKDSSGFIIRSGSQVIQVTREGGYFFRVDEGEDTFGYAVFPGKLPNQCTLVITEKPKLIRFLLAKIAGNPAAYMHTGDLRNFMETPDLYYGYAIRKIKVTDTNILVLRRLVPAKDKFNDAAAMLHELKQYLTKNNLKQTQPVMAQFLPSGKDSAQVNIGIPVNKKAVSTGSFTYMSMPATGYFYAVNFKGIFSGREKAYAAVYQYFKDRGLQVPLLPVENYLDNKLPVNDTSRINIRISFATFK